MLPHAPRAVLLGFVGGLGLVVAACAPGPEPAPEVGSPTGHEAGIDDTGDIVGQAPAVSQGSPSVIVLQPREQIDIPLPSEPAEMDQLGRDFIPRLLVVRQGQSVRFKNSEDELHTVHVKDGAGESLFNVAMPIRGGEHEHVFDAVGDYEVECNAHPEMHATILVVQEPYAVVADRDGAFTLPDVKLGIYDLILRQGKARHLQVVEIVAGPNELTVGFPPAG